MPLTEGADVHGCLEELRDLLKECQYDSEKDRVVIVGDLVNKGPMSAELVRYVMQGETFFSQLGLGQ